MVPPELYPPVPYAAGWLVSGIIAVILIVGLVGSTWWYTRPRPLPPPPPPPPPPHIDIQALGQRTADEIEQIRQASRRGAISSREAHQQISRLVRGFVTTASRIPVSHMTLSDLRDHVNAHAGLPGLADFVANIYPPNFAPDEAGPVDPAAQAAQQLVMTWR
ncbi:hypothetical protein [Parenemella sanctibonifatiensis]|uniref:Uncharacterized protein n=1 Tax=Parenemella sanctibonifatiensis TaxID=2016505 RepID=A0A255E5G8_9ACTN|nr:hypothetical protein [Parenemella sanctibonifatiensis]OYN84632.1 hypothetical protein CGZ92_12425 [Parenemella sanctibonifatiensis]